MGLQKSSSFCHNGVKFLKVEGIMGFSSIENISVVHKFSQFIIIECFSKLSCNSFEAVKISNTVTFIVPQLENFVDSFSG